MSVSEWRYSFVGIVYLLVSIHNNEVEDIKSGIERLLNRSGFDFFDCVFDAILFTSTYKWILMLH